jgi:hypothetical protein
MQTSQNFNEIIGYKKQPAGFATKAIHSGYKPEKWTSRFVDIFFF